MKIYTPIWLMIFSLIFALFAQNEILNAGFENWSNGEADGWHSNNVSGFPIGISQSSDAHSGSSAALVEVADLAGNPWIGALVTGSVISPFFDITENYAQLSGFYKLTLEGTSEFGGILVEFYDGRFGPLVAMGIGELTAADNYTAFNVTMDYTVGNGNPATAVKISFTFGADGLPTIGSRFLIDDLSLDGVVGIEEVKNGQAPEAFQLRQNYPNPFNPSTTIEFAIPTLQRVQLVVYNQLGQEVARLADEPLAAGNYQFVWDAGTLPSGVYFYRLTAGAFSESKKFILMK